MSFSPPGRSSERAGRSARKKGMFSPGIEPGLRPSQSRVRIRHTPRTAEVESGELRVESCLPGQAIASQLWTLHSQLSECLAEESNPVLRLRRPPCLRHTRQAAAPSIPTWIRTRAWTFGGSNAVRYTIGTGAHSSPGCPRGIEPPPSASQTDVQEPLHYGHHISGRQGIRTLTAQRPHGLANRPGKPYPATFRESGELRAKS